MKLLLDIGNSRIKWAEWDGRVGRGGVLTHRGRAPSAAFSELPLTGRPAVVWAASVADGQMRAAAEAWASAHGLPLCWAAARAVACGVRNGYRVPEQLGVDRWLAVIAAHRRAQAASLVVDAGTALTLDVVRSDGTHLGGLIAPGLHLQRLGLRQHTQLDPVPLVVPGWVGTDTDAAIALGTLHGCVGLIQRVLGAISAEYAPIALYLTGGDASTLLAHLSGDWQHVPELVIEGLGYLADETQVP